MGNIMDKKSIDEFFESLSDEELKEKFDKYERPENMSKYRFKTKEEFIRDGIWDDEHNTPKGWSIGGCMNRFLGEDISAVNNARCDDNVSIYENGWWFSSCDYVLKEESKNWSEWVPTKEINANGFEYFGDKLMDVSKDGEEWFRRVVFGKKNGKYLSWDVEADTLEDAKDCTRTHYWKYAKPIEIVKLTKKEIAEKFGLDVKDIEIVD